MRIGIDLDEFQLVGFFAGERVEFLNAFDLVAEELDAPGAVFIVRRKQVDDVAAHAEGAADEIHVGALVLKRDEIGDQCALGNALALLQGEAHAGIGFDRADAVNAGHGRDDDHVVALEQRARRRVAHAVDLFVDRRIFFYVGVGARDVGFRLVIVVIADEIFDRVVREEALELAVELGGQRLVGREDERGALGALDHLRHGVGLAGAGDAEQHLGAIVGFRAAHEFGNGRRLVALGLIGCDEFEAAPAFGFFRTLGPVRDPDLVLEFGAAFLDQTLQGVGRGRRAERRREFGFVGLLVSPSSAASLGSRPVTGADSKCAAAARPCRGSRRGWCDRAFRLSDFGDFGFSDFLAIAGNMGRRACRKTGEGRAVRAARPAGSCGIATAAMTTSSGRPMRQ
jgi:hypothetical protein